MTFVVSFPVNCLPVPKGRPRFRKTKNFVQTYTPKKTLDFEEVVRTRAKEAMGSSEPLEGPIEAFFFIRLPVPQSYHKSRSKACLEGLESPIKRPDLDNYAKSILDAMNEVVYKDDSQVISLHIKKIYAADPGVDILVREYIR